MTKEEKRQNLIRKYAYSSSGERPAAGPGPGPGGRHGRGMAGGKPKDMKKTLRRLFTYISAYKLHLILGLFVC